MNRLMTVGLAMLAGFALGATAVSSLKSAIEITWGLN
jgi:hypothetical protein